MDNLKVDGVFVGVPSVLGEQRGNPVLSGITKVRVAERELKLTELNLDGDKQADLSVHGGPDKAVYVYPAEHYPAWREDGFDFEPGIVGENLSVSGTDEDTVRIGDVWEWGDALVAVSQPRSPCFKLAMRTGRKDVTPAMIDTGRCGWYLRVLRPGVVPTQGAMTLVERDASVPSVAEMSLLAHANPARLDDVQRAAYRARLEHALATPTLAESWQNGLRAKLNRAG